MKYKPGDKVRVRTWQSMRDQYGVERKAIKTPKRRYPEAMARFCGQDHIIEFIGPDYYTFKEVSIDYRFTDDMIAGKEVGPKRGELVLATNSPYSQSATQMMYLGYMPGANKPHMVTTKEAFYSLKPFEVTHVSFVYQLCDLHLLELSIDGKDQEQRYVTPETLKKVKEVLNATNYDV